MIDRERENSRFVQQIKIQIHTITGQNTVTITGQNTVTITGQNTVRKGELSGQF